MTDKPHKELPEEFYQRRSGFSIFDFHKNPGWRLGTGSSDRGPVWIVAVSLSFTLGLWVAWADIVGGASFVRIAVIWIVVSGVAFYFIVRWQQTLLWSAVLAASGAALTLVLQLRFWLLNDGWPGWAVKDLPVFNEIVTENSAGLLLWLGNQSAIFTLIIASFLLLALTAISRRT